jgi:uncharacterized membrane protein YoaK (UPF0700 family)
MSTLSLNEKIGYAGGLAWVAGYINMITLMRFQAFGTMMTGNILLLARAGNEAGALHADEGNVLPDLWFYAGIIVARHFGLLAHALASKLNMEYDMILCGPVSVGLIFLSEYFTTQTIEETTSARWVVFLVAFTFGQQSAITHPIIGQPTILATGHLTNLSANLNSFVLGDGISANPDQLKLNFAIVFGLLIGAFSGGWADKRVEHYILTPITIGQVLVLANLERFHVEKKRRSLDLDPSNAPLGARMLNP